tara:strand:- start:82 stop:417 length:336 start_codon:yes stop_codon:yes gene_type:complete
MFIAISICVIIEILIIISIYKDIRNRFNKEVNINDEIIKAEPVIKERSRRISQNVKDKVWNRDGGKCTLCGSNEFLEFDHIIPFSKGGANSYRNIQLLCEECNRKKSDNIG